MWICPGETAKVLEGWGLSFLLNVLDGYVLKQAPGLSGPATAVNACSAWAVAVQAGEALPVLFSLQDVKAEGQEMLGWMGIEACASGACSRTLFLAGELAELEQLMRQARRDNCVCGTS